jgi:DNA-binding GntR family transcriptional regulator
MAVPKRAASDVPSSLLSGVAPIAYRTIAEQIAGSVREAIAHGRIPPAARLLEASLAREMGTSRAPVREALSQLEREGLVVKEPNRGARVVDVTEHTVREVASLRGLLEGYAASLAAERLDPMDFQALETILTDMDRAAGQGEFARLVELDYRFHAFICRASGHQVLYEAWSAMGGKIRLFLSTTNLAYRDLKAIVRGHREVLEALRARDRSRARRVLEEHLDEMLEIFVHRMLSPRPRQVSGATAGATGKRSARPNGGARRPRVPSRRREPATPRTQEERQ